MLQEAAALEQTLAEGVAFALPSKCLQTVDLSKDLATLPQEYIHPTYPVLILRFVSQLHLVSLTNTVPDQFFVTCLPFAILDREAKLNLSVSSHGVSLHHRVLGATVPVEIQPHLEGLCNGLGTAKRPWENWWEMQPSHPVDTKVLAVSLAPYGAL